MINIQLDRPMPPVMTDVLRPQLSAKMKAGTDIANIRIAETPDARKEAVPLDRPAWENRIGAYYCSQRFSQCQCPKNGIHEVRIQNIQTHIEDAIDAGQLDHSEDEQTKYGPQPILPLEDCPCRLPGR